MTPAKRLIMMGGRKYKNLIANGNFTNGTSDWSSVNSSSNVIAGTLINTSNGTDTVAYLQQKAFLTTNHKLYFAGMARALSSDCVQLRVQSSRSSHIAFNVPNPVVNQWYYGGVINTVPSDQPARMLHNYETAQIANGKSSEVAYMILVDLTAEFGTGSEPNLAWCDANIPQNIIW